MRQNFPLGYPRGIKVKADDPQTIYTTFGDTTPGSTGVIMRSQDSGANWESLNLPVEPNTAMWVVNSQRQNPDFLLAGSRYGYLYQSDNAGASWTNSTGSSAKSLRWPGSPTKADSLNQAPPPHVINSLMRRCLGGVKTLPKNTRPGIHAHRRRAGQRWASPCADARADVTTAHFEPVEGTSQPTLS